MMSFRTRLTSFFVLIVVVPMAAVGFLVFRLIDDSQIGQGRRPRQRGRQHRRERLSAASMQASLGARAVARSRARPASEARCARSTALAAQAGLARLTVKVGAVEEVDIGDHTAIAPGIAVVRARPAARRPDGGRLTAHRGAVAHELAGPGIEVVVRSGGADARVDAARRRGRALPRSRGSVTVGATAYQVVTQTFAGFDGSQVVVSILSDATASGGSVAADRVLAGSSSGVPDAGLLLLAAGLPRAARAARALPGRRAAAGRRRLLLAVPTSGHDEFALLGEEFNTMSRQLERRLAELEQERARVRQAIRRIGEAFASGLDRDALLELALETAMDATDAERGRVSARQSADDVLTETVHVGRLAGLEGPIYDAERRALTADGVGEASATAR